MSESAGLQPDEVKRLIAFIGYGAWPHELPEEYEIR